MLDAKNISSYIAPHPLYIQNMTLRRTFYIEWYKSVLSPPVSHYSGCQNEQSTRAPNKLLVYNEHYSEILLKNLCAGATKSTCKALRRIK